MTERSGATGFFQVAGTREVLAAFPWLRPLGRERVPLLDAPGRALAADVVADLAVPHFTRAAGSQVVEADKRRGRGVLWHRPEVFDALDLLAQGHCRVSPSIANPINGKEKTP